MNQCSFETVNYTSTGECQSVNYYSFFPQCVNKEGADINIPSHCYVMKQINWDRLWLAGSNASAHADTHTHNYMPYLTAQKYLVLQSYSP